jgi:Leucine-rich repeat (LRR) protein
MGCMNSKDVSPNPQPLLPAAEMHTVEDIIANAKASGSDTLNLAQNKANPDEELEEGWLVERGLDLEDGLPDSAFACTSVATFTMKAAQLPALPPGIGLMVQLVSLDLSENALVALPDEIGSLAALESLDLSENQLTTLPATIGGLTSLKTLIAFKNALKTLPDALGDCAALESLNLFNNKLGKVPPTLAKLCELTDVNLGGNKIKTMPKLDNWTKVEELRVHQNTLISQVLPSFAPMKALRFLKMDMNRAANALPELGAMPLLEHIECNNCSLEELPAKEAFDALPALKVLNAQSNQLREVPAFSNPELDTLNFSSNPRLTAMPDMSGCRKLRIFFMQGCAIETFDAGNADLPALERCMVMGNKIADDDATVAALRNTCGANGGWLKNGTE